MDDDENDKSHNKNKNIHDIYEKVNKDNQGKTDNKDNKEDSSDDQKSSFDENAEYVVNDQEDQPKDKDWDKFEREQKFAQFQKENPNW